MAKAVLLIQLTHSLGASNQACSAQKADEVDFVSYIKGPFYAQLEQDLACYLKDDTNRHRGNYIVHNEILRTLDDLWAQRRNPLRMSELSRNAVRNALRGRWFASALARLPLPPSMKSFVQTDLSRQFEQLDTEIDKAVRFTD